MYEEVSATESFSVLGLNKPNRSHGKKSLGLYILRTITFRLFIGHWVSEGLLLKLNLVITTRRKGEQRRIKSTHLKCLTVLKFLSK